MSGDALGALAREAGVQRTYRANDGTSPRAPVEAVAGALRALGLSVTGPSDAPAALEAWRRRQRARLVEPVLVAWRGRFRRPPTVSGPEGGGLEVRLTLEDGDRRQATASDAGTIDGRTAYVIDVPGGALPAGYHRLEVTSGSRREEALVVSAPARAYAQDRTWRGVVAPVPSLHTTDRAFTGTFSDLCELASWVAANGGDTVGTLPVLAREPGDHSPYSPTSRRMWDGRLVDPEEAPERAAAAFDGPPEGRGALIDLDARERRHDAVARQLFDCIDRLPARRQALDAFVANRPLVAVFARFRAAVERHGPDWHRWPEAVVDGVRSGPMDEASCRHAHLQQLAWEQMDAAAQQLAADDVALYLDFPVGVHPLGFDCFHRHELFATGVSVGAPPDALFVGGQNWGFPPVSPVASRGDGHRYVRECLAHHMAAADLLRIDHVMGFHRQFWIPDGMAADEGVFVRQPAEELWAIACLESHRHSCSLVGENLGTVPAEVDATLRRHRVSGLWVMPFATSADPERALAPVTEGDLAMLGTHDTPTFAGFWEGRDIDDLVDLELVDPRAAEERRQDRAARRAALGGHLRRLGLVGSRDRDPPLGALLDGMLSWLRESAATMVPLEDLWLEPDPQNVPGTTAAQRPNWRRRMRHPVDRLDDVPGVADRLRRLTRPSAPPTGGPSPMAARKQTDHEPTEVPRGAQPGTEPDPITGLTPDDVYLFNEGTHARLYEKLGAHPTTVDRRQGTAFAVWAPNAEAVSVKGEFCDWDDDTHPLEPLGGSGIWRGFVPEVGPGALYKFHIRSRHEGFRVDKADPFAFATEMPPATASRVSDLHYDWGDDEWMAERGSRNALDAPMSVYEVHLGSWRRVAEEGGRSIHYLEAAEQLADHVARLGFTHVELVPIMEHPFFGSWGYQTTSYFAPSARHGSPTELMAMIDALHQREIGVILDWVPSHFPTDEHGLAYFDGTHLYEHGDPRQGFHPDWNSYIFNYGRHEVRSFLISSALFWLDRYHVDGIRVDAVASMLYLDYSRAEGEWIPNRHGGRENLDAIDFLRRLNEMVYGGYPDVQTIAEESTAWPMVSKPTYVGGLGFGLKWDMGWMHDTLEYFRRDPIHRRHHHHELTFRMVYAFNENFVLPLSHDEVVHGKGSLLGRMSGDDWQRFANLRVLYGYMHGQPGKKLLFMGAEMAQPGEWDHDGTLDWHLLDDPRHRGMAEWLGHLNRLHQHEPALHELDCEGDGFQWVEANDAQHSVVGFIRLARDGSPVLVVTNLTPEPRTSYRVGVPAAGDWLEIANSDAEEYGGSGMGNLGKVATTPFPSHGHEQSLVLTLPPLSVLFLKPAP